MALQLPCCEITWVLRKRGLTTTDLHSFLSRSRPDTERRSLQRLADESDLTQILLTNLEHSVPWWSHPGKADQIWVQKMASVLYCHQCRSANYTANAPKRCSTCGYRRWPTCIEKSSGANWSIPVLTVDTSEKVEIAVAKSLRGSDVSWWYCCQCRSANIAVLSPRSCSECFHKRCSTCISFSAGSSHFSVSSLSGDSCEQVEIVLTKEA